MARLETFAEDIKLATAGIAPQAIAAQLARFARQELASAISSGRASQRYEKFVNGRPGAAEETVTPPGPILYVFSWWAEIIAFALAFAMQRSPERSGRFKRSWFVMVDGARTAAFDAVPAQSEVVITNNQPYARKIEVGHMQMSVPPGVVEDTRLAVQRQFGAAVSARNTFIQIAGGYALRRAGTRNARGVGSAIAYPALVLRMKGF